MNQAHVNAMIEEATDLLYSSNNRIEVLQEIITAQQLVIDKQSVYVNILKHNRDHAIDLAQRWENYAASFYALCDPERRETVIQTLNDIAELPQTEER